MIAFLRSGNARVLQQYANKAAPKFSAHPTTPDDDRGLVALVACCSSATLASVGISHSGVAVCLSQSSGCPGTVQCLVVQLWAEDSYWTMKTTDRAGAEVFVMPGDASRCNFALDAEVSW
jgi:hypothetical protein